MIHRESGSSRRSEEGGCDMLETGGLANCIIVILMNSGETKSSLHAL